jgi:hypothetical protein
MAGEWQTVMVGATDGILLTGAASRDPIGAGALFEYQGCFCDGTEAGNALVVSLYPGPVPRSYVCRPIAASDEYYGWHLFENKYASNTVLVRLAGTPGDLKATKVKSEDVEMASLFRLLSMPGEAVNLSDVGWVLEKDQSKLEKDISFTQGMLAREFVKPPEVRYRIG